MTLTRYVLKRRRRGIFTPFSLALSSGTCRVGVRFQGWLWAGIWLEYRPHTEHCKCIHDGRAPDTHATCQGVPAESHVGGTAHHGMPPLHCPPIAWTHPGSTGCRLNVAHEGCCDIGVGGVDGDPEHRAEGDFDTCTGHRAGELRPACSTGQGS